MLISQNAEIEKPDNNSFKMNSVDLNNADEFREKSSSLNAQKIKNINNLMAGPSPKDEKYVFFNDELKKHISILCKYPLPAMSYDSKRSISSVGGRRIGKKRSRRLKIVSDNAQKCYQT